MKINAQEELFVKSVREDNLGTLQQCLYGVNLNSFAYGRSLWEWALSARQESIVKFVFSSSIAGIKIKNQALFHCVRSMPSYATILVAAGANINSRHHLGRTPLMMTPPHNPLLGTLIELGGDTTLVDDAGWGVYSKCAALGSVPGSRLLLNMVSTRAMYEALESQLKSKQASFPLECQAQYKIVQERYLLDEATSGMNEALAFPLGLPRPPGKKRVSKI